MVYILMIIFTVDLLQILYNNKYINFKRLPKLLILIASCQIISYLIIYGSIYLTNNDRDNRISEGIKNNDAMIEIIDLPYSDYLHMGNVCYEYGELVFREYYKIPSSILIKGECRE